MIVNTAFRRELDDDRSFVVDCLDYRKGKDAELRQMARFTMEKAKTSRAAGDGPAQSVRAPHRPPDGGGGSGAASESIGDAFLKTVIISATVSAGSEVAERRRRVFSTDDTIVAIATPAGRGGIGVVRVSGPDAPRIASCADRTSGVRRHGTRRSCASARATLRDQAIVTSFPAPASYTGEDVVEISAHGSPVLLHAIVASAIDAGARLAEPGEFTLRAYLHGRICFKVHCRSVGGVLNLLPMDGVVPFPARAFLLRFRRSLSTASRAAAMLFTPMAGTLEPAAANALSLPPTSLIKIARHLRQPSPTLGTARPLPPPHAQTATATTTRATNKKSSTNNPPPHSLHPSSR